MPREDKPLIPQVGDTILVEAKVIEALDDDGDIWVEFRSAAGDTYIRPMDIVKIIAGPPRKGVIVTDNSRPAPGEYTIIEIHGETAWLQSVKYPDIQYLANTKDLVRVTEG